MTAVRVHRLSSFGPHRGALRYLLVKSPEKAYEICSRFGVCLSEILCNEVSVSSEMIDELWLEMSLLAEQDKCFWLAAGRLFQLQDLGERSWLICYSENLKTALTELQKIIHPAEFLIEQSADAVNIKMLFSAQNNAPLIYYFLSGFFAILAGLVSSAEVIRKIEIPSVYSGYSEAQLLLWNNKFSSEFGVDLALAGEYLTLVIEKDKLLLPLRSSDSALYAFFAYRISQNLISNTANNLRPSQSRLIAKIKQTMKSNLNSGLSGSQHIANELGISVRSLERLLALESLTLRSLKQEIQKRTAIELLQIGMRAKEVALQVGFDDVSSFTRAFSKWTGTPPSQMRKQTDYGK